MARANSKSAKKQFPPRKKVLLVSCMDQRLLDDTVHFMNSLNLHNRYDHLVFAGAAMGVVRLSSGNPDAATNAAAKALAGKRSAAATSAAPVTLPWRWVFFDHLKAAIDVLKREISDIYIIEHLDCGAYRTLHPDETIREEYDHYCKTDMSELTQYHTKEAAALVKQIEKFCHEQHADAQTKLDAAREELESGSPSDLDSLLKTICYESWRVDAWKDLRIRAFIMDLTGKVEDLPI